MDIDRYTAPAYAATLVDALTKNAIIEIAATAPYRNLSLKAGEKPYTFSPTALSSDAVEECAMSGNSIEESVYKDTHGAFFTPSFAQVYCRRLSSLRQHTLDFVDSIYTVAENMERGTGHKRVIFEAEQAIIFHTCRALCQSVPLIEFELRAIAALITTQARNFSEVTPTYIYPGDLTSYRNVDVSSLTAAAPISYLDLLAPQRLFQDVLQTMFEVEALFRVKSRQPAQGGTLFVGSEGINGPTFALFSSVSHLKPGTFAYTLAPQVVSLLEAAVGKVSSVSAGHVALGTPCATSSSLTAALGAFKAQAQSASGALFATPELLRFDTTHILARSFEYLRAQGGDSASTDGARGGMDSSATFFLTPMQKTLADSAHSILQLQLQHVQSLVGYTRTTLNKATGDKSEAGSARFMNANMCHISSLLQLADNSFRLGHYQDVAGTVERIRSEIANAVLPAITSSSNVVGTMKAWASALGAAEPEAIACSAHLRDLLVLKVKTALAKFAAFHTLTAPTSHFSFAAANNNVCFNMDELVGRARRNGFVLQRNHQYPLYTVYAKGLVDEVAQLQATMMATPSFKAALLFARNSPLPFVRGLEFADSAKGSEDRPVRRPASHATYFNITAWNLAKEEGSTPLFSPADFSYINIVRLVAAGICTRTVIPNTHVPQGGVRVLRGPGSSAVLDMYKVQNRPVSAVTHGGLSIPSDSDDQGTILATLLSAAAALRPYTLAPVDYSVASSVLLVGGGSREFLRYATLLALLSADAAQLDRGFCNIPEIRALLKREAVLGRKLPPNPLRPAMLNDVTHLMISGKFAAPLRSLSTDPFVRDPFQRRQATASASPTLGLDWESEAAVVSTYCHYSPLYSRSMSLLSVLLREHVVARAVAPYAAISLEKLAFTLGLSVRAPEASNDDIQDVDGDVDVQASLNVASATLEEQLKALILSRRLPPATKIDRAAGCLIRSRHTFGGTASSSVVAAEAATGAVAIAMIEGQGKKLESAMQSALIKGYLELNCMRGPRAVSSLQSMWERRSHAQTSNNSEVGMSVMDELLRR